MWRIENVSPFDFACVEVTIMMGHPSQLAMAAVAAVGYLRYELQKSPPGGKIFKRATTLSIAACIGLSFSRHFRPRRRVIVNSRRW